MEENKSPEEINQNDYSELTLSKYPKIEPLIAGFLGLALCFFLYQFGGGLIYFLFFGLNLTGQDPTLFRLFQTTVQILFLLVPAILMSKFIFGNVIKFNKIRLPEMKITVVLLAGMVVAMGLINFYLIIQNYILGKVFASSELLKKILEFLQSINAQAESIIKSMLTITGPFDLFFVIITVSVVPSICEEVLFRGYILNSLRQKMKPLLVILLTGLIFGAYHFQPINLIPLSILGFYFAYSVYVTNSIIPAVIMHFINNFSSLLFYYMGFGELGSFEIEQGDFTTALILFPVTVILLGALIFYIHKILKKHIFEVHNE